MADEDFMPKTRDDWVGLFRDGTLAAISADREAEAKAKQEGDKKDKTADTDTKEKPKGLANWLLGNK